VAGDNEGAKAMTERSNPRPEECVSIARAAIILGVCVRTVRREIDRRRLAAFRVGRSLRIKMSELLQYMESGAVAV
jgi:excisionase family DNA binding protein